MKCATRIGLKCTIRIGMKCATRIGLKCATLDLIDGKHLINHNEEEPGKQSLLPWLFWITIITNQLKRQSYYAYE